MKRGKKVADELQNMFVEGKLTGLDEMYINFLIRKLWTGSVKVEDLERLNPDLKEKIEEALCRMNSRNPY